ncbi:DNA polymerase III chi subunit [Marinobacterium lacunae]|uniref:DNA polymerase III chi subunit n=1 Tax=Marinobacterium lacunae TaxID=1232683 RepID=A0A081G216_9GAMM|nr:DNA polymerase III subunit chi [Marinobacterium lacunae]KEA64821.1 DNA polymerase III chi subunit [Marinobacterium lacunae]MBR9883226.1 DNA polymerase III subunit chi [Oceanospirillales bacterium]
MSRADYYILADADPDSRELFLCRLCEKILGLGLNIYIHMPSESDAERLDQRLWAFRPDAFVPHVILGDKPSAPIEIGHGEQRPEHREVFINLALSLPEDAFEFQRIVEIVVQDADVLEATRQNYQRCRDRGVELHRTDMR